jgi:hypothetical protein
MTENGNEFEIVIKNKKIYDFYKENKNIDIVTANLLLINFVESIFNHMTNDINSNINSQLLSYMSDNKTQIDNIKNSIFAINENVTKLNSDIANNMMIQFMNLKKDYIDDVKQIINNNTLTANEKLSSLIDKNNNHLIDKTSLILNDVIPKNQEQINKHIQENFKQLHFLINEDTNKLAKTMNNEKSLHEFINNFETKYNSMMQTIQQPLYTFMTASEDRLTKNLDVLKENSNNTMFVQNKLFDELGDFLSRYKNSSSKGKFGENNLAAVLNGIYSNAEIINTANMKASGDFIMKRLDKPSILFENKEYDNNIPKDEIAKFIRYIDTQNMNGIFISQYSGIAFKQNFQIDLNKGNVLVYIQNCEYSTEKIKMAVDIIDTLSVKIQELNLEDENNSISKETLDDINEEYLAFINQKESMITFLKDFQKKMTTQIEDLKLPVLDKYLEPKYAYVKDRVFICDLCNNFTAGSKQSLSAHKRGCNKKNKVPTMSAAFKPCVPTQNTIVVDTSRR